MNLRNVILGVSMLTTVGIIAGCGSHINYADLKNKDEYKEAVQKVTAETTEKLILKLKANYDYSYKSQMGVFNEAWRSILHTEATLETNKELKNLYTAGLVWANVAELDANDINMWLVIEQDAKVRGVQTTPLSINVVDKAMQLTSWRLKKSTSEKQYRYDYNTLNYLLMTHVNACHVKNIYAQTEPIYYEIRNTLMALNGTNALAYHSGKGSMYKETHDQAYNIPFSTLTCTSDMTPI